MAKFVVALFRNIFLPYSETFIYDSMNHYKDFTPVVFAKKRINHDFFPFDPVYVPKQICKAGRIAHLFFTTGVVSTACLAEKFKQHQPKIIHAHFGQSGVLAIPYAKKFNLPLIVTLHGNDVGLLLGKQKYLPKWWFYTLSLQRLIHTTTLFLAGSTELKERFQELGCPDNKIKVHRLAIDLNKFHLSKKENQSTSIFMVGRLVEKKGFEYGIRAFAAALNQLNDTVSSDVKLYVIGDGPLKADLKALVQSLKLQNSVHFLGKQSHEQVWKLLQTQGDILMCPSVVARNQDRDSGLIVAKEAAACGLPAIGTRHGGIPEIIDDQKTGFLVPERDVEGLAQRLKEVLINPDLRKTLGQAARKKMENEYNIKNQIAELESIYFETIHKFRSQKEH